MIDSHEVYKHLQNKKINKRKFFYEENEQSAELKPPVTASQHFQESPVIFASQKIGTPVRHAKNTSSITGLSLSTFNNVS